ncbi:hypothetical protein A4X13_0g7897 [Tilletia indica]|uniref:Uncharacterized protein n=1 Tax=Tilletia indica TaxID=43049 RepID=A0A8T8SH07_9BASI|nr:hypothetical protein A4X13_0g7897 [Tilletia indica]
MPARSRRYISNRQRDHHWQAERHLNCVESTTLNHGAGVTSDESQPLREDPQVAKGVVPVLLCRPASTRTASRSSRPPTSSTSRTRSFKASRAYSTALTLGAIAAIIAATAKTPDSSIKAAFHHSPGLLPGLTVSLGGVIVGATDSIAVISFVGLQLRLAPMMSVFSTPSFPTVRLALLASPTAVISLASSEVLSSSPSAETNHIHLDPPQS